MKTAIRQSRMVGRALRARRGQAFTPMHKSTETGSAVLVILILLCIMVVFVTANTVTVNWLRRQVSLVEKQELHRLAAHSAPVAANPPLSK